MSKFPKTSGVYLVRGIPFSSDLEEIDVYEHPIKGLCCFKDDFGSIGTQVNGNTDDHVSVQNTGLEFIKKVRELK